MGAAAAAAAVATGKGKGKGKGNKAEAKAAVRREGPSCSPWISEYHIISSYHMHLLYTLYPMELELTLRAALSHSTLNITYISEPHARRTLILI